MNYSTKQETASLTRKATPNELWLYEQLDRINPNRHEMGNAGDTQALTILVFELRDQRDESDSVLNMLAKHLAGVAIALKGPELALHRHGYHDLAEKAQVAMLEIELLKHENQRLTGEAKVLRDLLGEAVDMIEDILKQNELVLTAPNQISFGQMVKACTITMINPLAERKKQDDTKGGAL